MAEEEDVGVEDPRESREAKVLSSLMRLRQSSAVEPEGRRLRAAERAERELERSEERLRRLWALREGSLLAGLPGDGGCI